MKTILVLRSLLVGLLIASATAFGLEQPRSAPPKRVLVVLFENASLGDVATLPFFAQIAARGALLANMHAERHPSQPNYVALISGDTQGVTDDSNVTLDVTHIGDLLEAKGKNWKAYAEAYPGNCYTGSRSGTYARKHEPFISFKNIQTNPSRCSKIVDASVLDEDIAAGTLPDFALYIPDMNNDGHDTGAAYADKWFSGKFGPLLDDPRFMRDTLLVATFDEGDGSDPKNQIYTAFVGDSVKAGYKSQVEYNHYSLLKTFENLLGLDSLNRKDATAQAVTDTWAY